MENSNNTAEEVTAQDIAAKELLDLLTGQDPALTVAEVNRCLRLIEPDEEHPFDVAIAATKALMQRKASCPGDCNDCQAQR